MTITPLNLVSVDFSRIGPPPPPAIALNPAGEPGWYVTVEKDDTQTLRFSRNTVWGIQNLLLALFPHGCAHDIKIYTNVFADPVLTGDLRFILSMLHTLSFDGSWPKDNSPAKG